MKTTPQGEPNKVVDLAKTVFRAIGDADTDTAIAALRVARTLVDHREALRLTRTVERFNAKIEGY